MKTHTNINVIAQSSFCMLLLIFNTFFSTAVFKKLLQGRHDFKIYRQVLIVSKKKKMKTKINGVIIEINNKIS
jgi:hypothetical protein